MRRNDWIRYKGVTFPRFYSNKNLAYAIACVAYKYGMTCKLGREEIPKMRQAKLFIKTKCTEYFEGVEITLNQIDSLLYPQKMRFPYTAIIIIETIYNLLKEKDWDKTWKGGLKEYLITNKAEDSKYEHFMFGELLEGIIVKKDEYMTSEYSEIYKCFTDSRELYYNKINDTSMREHCEKNFPSEEFSKKDIPESMLIYQDQRVYMKERK